MTYYRICEKHTNICYNVHMQQTKLNDSPDRKTAVLGEAVINAGAKLGLSQSDVGQIIGRDRTSIARNGIDPTSKSGEMAMFLVRIYRGLYALVGGDDTAMQHWMNSPIRSLGGFPRQLIFRVDGLIYVMEYIDAMRAKV